MNHRKFKREWICVKLLWGSVSKEPGPIPQGCSLSCSELPHGTPVTWTQSVSRASGTTAHTEVIRNATGTEKRWKKHWQNNTPHRHSLRKTHLSSAFSPSGCVSDLMFFNPIAILDIQKTQQFLQAEPHHFSSLSITSSSTGSWSLWRLLASWRQDAEQDTPSAAKLNTTDSSKNNSCFGTH